jgi:DNA-binding beta-propeller fold protein YncE
VTAKVKTGFLVGQLVEDIPAVGGSSPNSVVAAGPYVFVSNGNNDCISVIDVRQDTVGEKTSSCKLTRDWASCAGSSRSAWPSPPTAKRLYVAEAGINAVGRDRRGATRSAGSHPGGLVPGKLAVSRDGKKLIVANAKGYGSGPNGGRGLRDGGRRQLHRFADARHGVGARHSARRGAGGGNPAGGRQQLPLYRPQRHGVCGPPQ